MMRNEASWLWPGDRHTAIVFDVFLEGWSDGRAPGITPMGNPFPPASGQIDTMAVSWAAYGVNTGIYRLLDVLARHEVRANMMVNGVIAERAPAIVKVLGDSGHDIVGHSYAMDLIPTLQSEEDERTNIVRCKTLLSEVSGQPVDGWISPRVTPSPRTERFLVEAGYTWHGDILDRDTPEMRTISGSQIVAIPFQTDVNDMPLVKHGLHPSSMLDAYARNVEIVGGSDVVSIINVAIHSHIGGHIVPAHFYEMIVASAVSDARLWICTRGEIADHVLARTVGAVN